MRRSPLVLSVLATALLATGCGSDSEATANGTEVVAAAYPFAWLASQVGGSDVSVVELVKPGTEPHDVELAPRQVATVQRAEVVVYLKGFQPAVDDALADGKGGFDLSAVITQLPGDPSEGGTDPHFWLDPQRMQTAAVALGARLAEADPAHAEGYRTRADTTARRLGELDATFKAALTGCARKDIVTSHAAFGYLAARYGLVQRSISGLTPDAEPSPGRVAEVAKFARDNGVTTIFFETLVDPKVAKTVADEIGAKTAVLDPVEGVKAGEDYLVVQERNAKALHDALGCA